MSSRPSAKSKTREPKVSETEVVHRHFRMTPHPAHHEHYHNILLIVILLVILFGVSALVDNTSLRLRGVGSKGREISNFGAQKLDVPPSDDTYEQSVKSALGNALLNVEVSEESLAETRGVKKALMDMIVPKKYLDAHLGLVLLLSRKADVIEKALQGSGGGEVAKLSEDLRAFLESYEWIEK